MLAAYFKFLRNDKTGRIDIHLVLFTLNAFLVVLGYGLRGASFQLVKLGRTGLVVISLVWLFAKAGNYLYEFQGRKSWMLWFFILINLYALAFSVDFMYSLVRISAWFPFLIYINYFIVYLFRKYDKETARLKILQIFNFCYLYPVIGVYIFGNPLVQSDIYGADVGGFKSNVLGWASIVLFVTSIDIITNGQPKLIYKRIIIGVAVLGLLVLSITGSRSGYLSLAITLMIIIANSNRIAFSSKIFMCIATVGLTYYMLNDPKSAINARIEKSEMQAKKGEVRLEMATLALRVLDNNPNLILTGFGYDNFRNGIKAYTGIELELPSHNSYLELLTTTGAISFLFFFFCFFLNALVQYILYDIKKFVYLPTLLIIPFFESNLNSGQFLFFPWMTFLFFYIHCRSPQVPFTEPARETMSDSRKILASR